MSKHKAQGIQASDNLQFYPLLGCMPIARPSLWTLPSTNISFLSWHQAKKYPPGDILS